MNVIFFLTNRGEEGIAYFNTLERYSKDNGYKLYPLVLSMYMCDIKDFCNLLEEFIAHTSSLMVIYNGGEMTLMAKNRARNGDKVAFSVLQNIIRGKFTGSNLSFLGKDQSGYEKVFA